MSNDTSTEVNAEIVDMAKQAFAEAKALSTEIRNMDAELLDLDRKRRHLKQEQRLASARLTRVYEACRDWTLLAGLKMEDVND